MADNTAFDRYRNRSEKIELEDSDGIVRPYFFKNLNNEQFIELLTVGKLVSEKMKVILKINPIDPLATKEEKERAEMAAMSEIGLMPEVMNGTSSLFKSIVKRSYPELEPEVIEEFVMEHMMDYEEIISKLVPKGREKAKVSPEAMENLRRLQKS